MWTWLKSLLGNKSGAVDDQRAAVAALLRRAVAVDGVVADEETELLGRILMARYQLGRREAEALLAAGMQADNRAGDLQTLADHAARGLDAAGKLAIIEMLWQISMADDHIHEFEDSLVWRVADMLGVPAHDRIAAKRRAGQMIDKG